MEVLLQGRRRDGGQPHARPLIGRSRWRVLLALRHVILALAGHLVKAGGLLRTKAWTRRTGATRGSCGVVKMSVFDFVASGPGSSMSKPRECLALVKIVLSTESSSEAAVSKQSHEAFKQRMHRARSPHGMSNAINRTQRALLKVSLHRPC